MPSSGAAPQDPSSIACLLAKTGEQRYSLFAADDTLWAKLGKIESVLGQAEKSASALPLEIKESILRQCREHLNEARACLLRKKWRWTLKSATSTALFWQLVHQVDADLLLIVPEDLLAAMALEVENSFNHTISDKLVRQQWLGPDGMGPLPQAIARLTGVAPALSGRPQDVSGAPAQLMQDRHILRSAMRTVNKHADRHFRQLSLDMLVQVLSSGLLIVMLILLTVVSQRHFPYEERGMPAVLLILLFGAGGAILSNMLTQKPFRIPEGQTGRFFSYYLFAKPVLGAWAALVFLILEQSEILFHIMVRGGSTQSAPFIQIAVSSISAAYFTRLMLALVTGFAADRLLGKVIDDVIGRVFKLASKEEVSDPSSLSPSLGPAKQGRGTPATSSAHSAAGAVQAGRMERGTAST